MADLDHGRRHGGGSWSPAVKAGHLQHATGCEAVAAGPPVAPDASPAAAAHVPLAAVGGRGHADDRDVTVEG